MIRRDGNLINAAPTVKALPCPFCKSENITVGTIHHPEGHEAKYAFCADCGAAGPRNWNNQTADQAIEAWNRRTT